MSDLRLGVLAIDVDVLQEALAASNFTIIGVKSFDQRRHVVEFIVTSPDLPAVPAGMLMPEVTAIVTVERKTTKVVPYP